MAREEQLEVEIPVYNLTMQRLWPDHKKKCNLSGDLSTCEYCGRHYVICCICDKAKERWDDTIAEIQSLQDSKQNELNIPPDGEKIKKEIENTIKDLVADFLYYDRKEDEDLPKGEIEKAIGSGVISIAEIITIFDMELRKKL